MWTWTRPAFITKLECIRSQTSNPLWAILVTNLCQGGRLPASRDGTLARENCSKRMLFDKSSLSPG